MVNIFNKKRFGIFLVLSILIVSPLVVSFSIGSFFDDFLEGFGAVTGMAGGGGDCAYTCRISCTGSEVQVSGNCIDPNICCRPKDVCGDGFLDSGEICEGGNLNGETCASQGFVNGTLSCSSCSFDNSSCLSCGDGTCDATDTCNGCPGDCNGSQADCSSGQVCTVVLGSGSCVAAAPEVEVVASTTTTSSGGSSYGGMNLDMGDAATVSGIVVTSTTPISSGYGVEFNQGSSSEVYEASVTYQWDKLRKKDEIEISVREEKHKIEIKKVTTSSNKKTVTVIISSEPKEYELEEGVSKFIDLDGDGKLDMEILALNVGLGGKFDLIMREFMEVTIDEVGNVNRFRASPFEEKQMSPKILGPFMNSVESSWYGFVAFSVVMFVLVTFFFYRVSKGFKRK
ncbi:hypothetical protein K8R33_01260 [archaeon]|nr:hypothetical protein [archaeon]